MENSQQNAEKFTPDEEQGIRKEWRRFFREGKNPKKRLLKIFQNPEFRKDKDEQQLEKMVDQIFHMNFEDEEESIEGILEIVKPLYEKKKKEGKDIYEKKQENRELYSKQDIENAADMIKEKGYEKIYVVGMSGSGKSSYARELTEMTGYKNLDIDHYFKEVEKESGETTLEEVMDFVQENYEPPYIITHADLLRKNLVQNADMIIHLNPRKEELLKSYEIRRKNGADGEWKDISEEEIENIIKENERLFSLILENEIYKNKKTGTVIRSLN